MSAALRLAVVTVAALATPAAAAEFRLDNAVVVGSGRQITITRLPIVAADGTVTFVDATLQLAVGAGNALTVATAKTTPSTEILTGALTPGRYRVHGTSPELVMKLIGPTIGANNRAMWTLVGEKVAQQMNFWDGAIKGHPLQKRVERVGIVYAGQSFGSTSRNTSFDGWYFDERQLVALQPLGRAVALTSWSYNGADAPLPLRTLTLFPCDATTCK